MQARAPGGDDEGGENTSTTAATADTTADDAQLSKPRASDVYSESANWLCRPDVTDDPCDIDLDATLVTADGTQTVEPFEAAVDPPVDCIYVYPTISTDQSVNSDRVPDDAEIGIVANQAARFQTVCDLYVPMYRQITLSAMFDSIDAADSGESTNVYDDDSRTAPETSPTPTSSKLSCTTWRSTTTGDPSCSSVTHRERVSSADSLQRRSIPNETLRNQLVSAMLIGTSVTIDSQEDDFSNIVPCTSSDGHLLRGLLRQLLRGRNRLRPTATSVHPATATAGPRAQIRADLSNSGPAPLNSYFEAGHAEGAPEVSTPWIHYEGLLTGECVADRGFDWLEVTNTAGTGSAAAGRRRRSHHTPVGHPPRRHQLHDR